MSYSLHIVTSRRPQIFDDQKKDRPYHWAFFLQTGTERGDGSVLQLHGMPGAFYYEGEEKVVPHAPGSIKAEVEIGAVPVARYERFKELLKAVPISKDESSGWNCQDWSLQALASLREEGFVDDTYSDAALRYWLREEDV
ncbi:hypothetical protein EJ05DRAFT_104917 [Pseudovirgaria hyperparasitica]|uniref:Uncharacterized protein n=1 Tax=Pseudovirgaria hyperparasitica TaxID=470096 RepID=A0A6A6W057_9PEZI|nr:uncharacterized protein EJ05DRAFT_104917 [Pseudovirgaria hyperparasitica]KAF2755529.1 hypothetical protein EJ05DRAFT_104917 [Pseudovirgaria hyperparasitica]